MKLLVLGHKRHGKDTCSSILRELYGLSFVSSSFFVGEKAVRPWLESRGIVYPSMDACYADRGSSDTMRAHWFDAISDYNKNDPARLGRELFAQYDIYCGLRNVKEFQALKAEKAFDVCFWVDRSNHCPPEPTTSFNIGLSFADYIIDNNNTQAHLKYTVIENMERAMNDGLIPYKKPRVLNPNE